MPRSAGVYGVTPAANKFGNFPELGLIQAVERIKNIKQIVYLKMRMCLNRVGFIWFSLKILCDSELEG
ncbi:hypothetical protein DLM75_14855 [Leptospira stimsonii]|uniref:Uncharacterized protein n=1 Tax=Leptospira stimsonii TaxID=2202203 RepID=A0A396Z780_9LEPT|nr:hypothetical protein DLM75_14855 [Leptospira stimsonii]